MKNLQNALDELTALVAKKAAISDIVALISQKVEFIYENKKTITTFIFSLIMLDYTEGIIYIARVLQNHAVNNFLRLFEFRTEKYVFSSSALHVAVLYGNLNTLKIILNILGDKKIAGFNVKDSDGNVPLALSGDDLEKFKYLLKVGASVTLLVPDKCGLTPLQLIVKGYYRERAEGRTGSKAISMFNIALPYLLISEGNGTSKLTELEEGPFYEINISGSLEKILEKNLAPQVMHLLRVYLVNVYNLSTKKYLKIQDCSEDLYEIKRWELLSLLCDHLQGETSASLAERHIKLLHVYNNAKNSINFDHLLNLINAFELQFSNKRNFSDATKGFEKCSEEFPESFILLGYQFFTGQGQPKNYIKAQENYSLAFKQAHIRKNSAKSSLDKLFYRILCEIAISCIKRVFRIFTEPNLDPTLAAEKMRTSLILIECYLLQENYETAQQQIDATNDFFLNENEKHSFRKLAGEVYYQLFLKCTDDDNRKTKFLTKASDMQHSLACYTLAKKYIDNTLGSDYISALKLLIESLNALGEVKAQSILELLTEVIKKLLHSKNDQEISKLIFKSICIIFRRTQVNADNWQDYRHFLQGLRQETLFKNDRLFIEYILFTAYKNGRAADEKDLKIATTTFLIFTIGKASDTEKKRKIDEKLDEITKTSPKLFDQLERFKDHPEQDIDQFYNQYTGSSNENNNAQSKEEEAAPATDQLIFEKLSKENEANRMKIAQLEISLAEATQKNILLEATNKKLQEQINNYSQSIKYSDIKTQPLKQQIFSDKDTNLSANFFKKQQSTENNDNAENSAAEPDIELLGDIELIELADIAKNENLDSRPSSDSAEGKLQLN